MEVFAAKAEPASASVPLVERVSPLILAEERLAAQLAPIADPAAFIADAARCARARGVVVSEADLLAAVEAGPVPHARVAQSAHVGTSPPPRQWLPIGIGAAAGAISIDWAWFGPRPLRDPFYEDEMRRVLRLPFNRVFRYRTVLADLVVQAEALDSLAPAGFIFHMSRCGSTLVAQMLAALSDSIVISEAAPIDAVVQLAHGFSSDDAARALRAIIAAFGRKRAGGERRFVVKLDCWHSLALPLFRRAFPDVPWLFLYRDPVEVMVSQMRQLGIQMVPQFLPPSLFGLADADATMDEDYCARVLAAVCRAVIDHGTDGRGLVLNYRDLPEAVFDEILPHFGIGCDARERESMHAAARRDAKTPTMLFFADGDAKQGQASEKIRRAADCHLADTYRGLEKLQRHAI